MAKKPANRGRVQAQGGGIEESVSWAQENPPTGDEGHGNLEQLHGMLTPAEQEYREEGFAQAHMFVTQAESQGGVDASMGMISKTFPRKPRRDHRRVDIEVHTGKAFVPVTETS